MGPVERTGLELGRDSVRERELGTGRARPEARGRGRKQVLASRIVPEAKRVPQPGSIEWRV